MSLFANLETEQEGSKQQEHEMHLEEGQESVNWWIDDGIPGQGDRPDWLPAKFKSVKDLGNSYKHLEQRFGEVPKSYSFEAAMDWADPDYEPFEEMAQFAKENHVSQRVMDKFLGTVGKYLNEFKPDYEAERAKLGENAIERLTTLDNWAKTNLSEKSYMALFDNLKSAEAVEAIEEIRTKMLGNKTTIPGFSPEHSSESMTVDAVKNEMSMNYDKYKNDPAYRKYITDKLNFVMNKK